MRLPPKFFWSILPLVIGIIAPALIVFVLETTLGGVPFPRALSNIASRQFDEGENFFLLALIGLIPFVLLSIFSLVAARFLPARCLAAVSLGGLIGILAYMVPAHVSAWRPIYAGGHVSSTSAIAFLFIPFYCVGTLVAGCLIGWVVSLLPALRHQNQ